MSRNSRLGVIAAAFVVVVIAFVVANSTSSTSTQDVKSSGAAHVTVVGGQPQGGIAKLTYHQGQTIDLTVSSDSADEIHIHGYDLHQTVTRGGSVHFSFPASIQGLFVIELENAKRQIASLKVTS